MTIMKQTILCLDMEWVLTPEIWEELWKKTGIKELELTTKDIADYDELMKLRLKIMNENNIGIDYIQSIVSKLNPYDWVIEFLDWARTKMQVIILSDTYIEFVKPLVKKMKNPTIFCHNLLIDKQGKITGYKLRINDQKTKAVKSFKELNFNVIAAWDSFNDTGMLKEADNWFFFKPWKKAVEQFPNIKIANNYLELKNLIEKCL